MTSKKYLFAGNRIFVLEDMLERGLDVTILAVRGSHLERELRERGTAFTGIESKSHLISVLASADFDYFISNGCPYILPISELKDGRKSFVNIHPSPLPDLKGADPVPGALLFDRDSGATCHVMDDGIDTGPIISRVVVPLTDDLDAGLLYQISFLAEREVFELASRREFQPEFEQQADSGSIHYTRHPDDLWIDMSESTRKVIARIRAFSNRSQGARLLFPDQSLVVFDAEEVRNPYLMQRKQEYRENEVVFRYENCLLVRHGDAFLKLKAIEGDLSPIRPGDALTEGAWRPAPPGSALKPREPVDDS